MKKLLCLLLILCMMTGSAAAEIVWVITPTAAPTVTPSATATKAPTKAPTEAPTEAPTATPMATPTASPTASPTNTPTPAPALTGTPAPTEAPTEAPTATPTNAPTETPTAAPAEPRAAEPIWYEPDWYDDSTGRMDLTGLAVPSLSWLRAVLEYIPGLQYVDLSYCSLSNEELAQLRDDLAPKGIKVVWTLLLKFGYEVRTDAWVFSTRHSSTDPRLEDEDVDCLRYATELRALDLGHNWIFHADFLAPMTELRVLILSDNKMEDLSMLAGKPLEYLEIFNTHVSDISFLRGCDTLLDINLCHTWVGDLSPLYHLKNLKRIWMGDAPMMTLTERKRFLSYQQENLEAYDFWTDIPTLYGWRGDENGPGHPRYEIIKAMFKEGVYYDFNTVLRPDQYVVLRRKK